MQKSILPIVATFLLVVITYSAKTHALESDNPLSVQHNQIDVTDDFQLPQMVNIPGGAARMGCVSDLGCMRFEKPVHNVSLRSFEISKYEVTFQQWDLCVAKGGCDYIPDDSGWGRGLRPVVNVSWDDIQIYIEWLNQESGKQYRLPTEAEWEHAARAGSPAPYHWGSEIGDNNANCDGCGSQWDDKKTAPVGAFNANAWGVHDMHGNVYEWVQDCWNSSYRGAPDNGASWDSGDCSKRVLRGGAWSSSAQYIRVAIRYNGDKDYRGDIRGFRLARTL